jgi:hypothetical protein
MASKNIDTLTYGARSYYPSNINGMRILNAVTGIAYDDLVGSKEEVKLPQGCYNPSTNKLYYDNREEWMRHRNIKKDQINF